MLFLKSQLSPFALQAKIGCSMLCKLTTEKYLSKYEICLVKY